MTMLIMTIKNDKKIYLIYNPRVTNAEETIHHYNNV